MAHNEPICDAMNGQCDEKVVKITHHRAFFNTYNTI